MKVITFGEIMLRLAPEGYLRFLQADKYLATYGGGEANVAVSLSSLGLDTEFITKLPDNPIGQGAVNSLRKFGVGTKHIARGGDRIGIYFLEKGASQRGSLVVYDRKGSAIAKAEKADFDWSKIFAGADWFHFTGITPALSKETAEITLIAVKSAKEAGLTISCDLNYRKKLWTKEEAGNTMAALMPYVDVLIANEEDAGDVFGIKAKGSNIEGGKINREGYEEVAKELISRFGFKYTAITLRESISANDNNWSALLCHEDKFYFSKEYPIRIVDRVGGGDSFGAGLIYSLLNNYSPQRAIDFAVAASCLKHTIEGDFNLVTVKEIETLAGGNTGGRVSR